MENMFNEDYYERGPEKGVSCYVNYQWLPHKTIPAVMTYVDYLGIKPGQSILDFGCAKGYYVKALRLLHRDAWGCDISSYAISSSDDETKPFLKVSSLENPVPFDRHFDFIVSKDVLEHMEVSAVDYLLNRFLEINPKRLFVIVPLALNNKYIIPEDELDITHKIRFSKNEWVDFFESCGWNLVESKDKLPGIKDHQAKYLGGVGLFNLKAQV